MVARTQFQGASAAHLASYPEDLEFDSYLTDPVTLPPGTALAKYAGQLCYASFSPRRTPNEKAERYFTNIFAQKHLSIIEHTSFSFILWGISRSLTHELIRHRLASYSQLSQRYCDGKVLRFVLRPELAADPDERVMAIRRYQKDWAEYHALITRMAGKTPSLPGESATDKRKRVQQVARELLPNATETALIVTANARAWRHVLQMRGSLHAELEIRQLVLRLGAILKQAEPLLFSDVTFHGNTLEDAFLTVENTDE